MKTRELLEWFGVLFCRVFELPDQFSFLLHQLLESVVRIIFVVHAYVAFALISGSEQPYLLAFVGQQRPGVVCLMGACGIDAVNPIHQEALLGS